MSIVRPRLSVTLMRYVTTSANSLYHLSSTSAVQLMKILATPPSAATPTGIFGFLFPFCFEYSYDTDEYKCYSKHFSDEIVENDFAYFIVENYEQSCRNVKEVLKRRE